MAPKSVILTLSSIFFAFILKRMRPASATGVIFNWESPTKEEFRCYTKRRNQGPQHNFSDWPGNAMSKPAAKQIVEELFREFGQTFADETGIRLRGGGPSALFRWFCTCLLLSARIGGGIAIEASRALAKSGWTTPRRMSQSTWADRAKVLNEAGYARYDERTSTMLGDSSRMMIDRYKGDLRRLREEAEREPEAERKLLKEFKGIGEIGVDIFFREIQGEWPELFPFADKKSLITATRLGLPDEPETLAKLVNKEDFPLLLGALVRCNLAKAEKEILAKAA